MTQGASAGEKPIVEAVGLRVEFRPRSQWAYRAFGRGSEGTLALDDVSLSVAAQGALGIVGESGSGKSTFARSLVQLVQPDRGSVWFDGVNVLQLKGSSLAAARRKMQLIYQDPYSSLNPALTVAQAISEPALVHGLVAKADASRRVRELMGQVGLPTALQDRRPSELSGGQRQRVAIARSLSAAPDVLIADEAVSALDVSVQAQILALFADLRRDLGLTLIFVSHQLATVAQLCEQVAIMYRGRVVERGPTAEVFRRPRHGYTVALLEAHPGSGRVRARSARTVARTVAVGPPGKPGCVFRHRCEFVRDECHKDDPDLVVIDGDHVAACHVLTNDPHARKTSTAGVADD